jgi:hypothetical protein
VHLRGEVLKAAEIQGGVATGALTNPLESRPINLVEINQRNAMFKSVELGIFARTCNGLAVIGYWS